MRIRVLPVMLVLLTTLLWAAPHDASAWRWRVDPPHSAVKFLVDHIFVKVPGTFDEYAAEVVFDPAHPERGKVEVLINAASVNTRVLKRDEHLRSADLFDVVTYPTMRFSSESIVQIGENEFVVHGLLTIKDTTRKVWIPFTWFGVTDDPLNQGQKVAGLEGRLTLDRHEFGVGEPKWAEMGVIGRMVDVVLYIELLRDTGQAQIYSCADGKQLAIERSADDALLTLEVDGSRTELSRRSRGVYAAGPVRLNLKGDTAELEIGGVSVYQSCRPAK